MTLSEPLERRGMGKRVQDLKSREIARAAHLPLLLMLAALHEMMCCVRFERSEEPVLEGAEKGVTAGIVGMSIWRGF